MARRSCTTFTPAPDQDWVWFDARGGQEYIIATRDASASIDTRLTSLRQLRRCFPGGIQ